MATRKGVRVKARDALNITGLPAELFGEVIRYADADPLLNAIPELVIGDVYADTLRSAQEGCLFDKGKRFQRYACAQRNPSGDCRLACQAEKRRNKQGYYKTVLQNVLEDVLGDDEQGDEMELVEIAGRSVPLSVPAGTRVYFYDRGLRVLVGERKYDVDIGRNGTFVLTEVGEMRESFRTLSEVINRLDNEIAASDDVIEAIGIKGNVVFTIPSPPLSKAGIRATAETIGRMSSSYRTVLDDGRTGSFVPHYRSLRVEYEDWGRGKRLSTEDAKVPVWLDPVEGAEMALAWAVNAGSDIFQGVDPDARIMEVYVPGVLYFPLVQ